MRDLAMLKYYVLRIQNDDLLKLRRNKEIIDNIISQGFDEMFNSKKVKVHKPKSERGSRSRRHRSRKKKQEEKENEDEELTPKEIAVNYALEEINNKLYGLIAPKAGNFLPDFFDMLKLMTFKAQHKVPSNNTRT